MVPATGLVNEAVMVTWPPRATVAGATVARLL
jgi:hypothetical protein